MKKQMTIAETFLEDRIPLATSKRPRLQSNQWEKTKHVPCHYVTIAGLLTTYKAKSPTSRIIRMVRISYHHTVPTSNARS